MKWIDWITMDCTRIELINIDYIWNELIELQWIVHELDWIK